MQEIVTTTEKMMGEKAAYSSTLQLVVDQLSHEQKSELIDELNGRIEAIQSKPNRSDLMQAHGDTLERIAFQIRESQRLMNRDQSRDQDDYFVCFKCDVRIVPAQMDSVCPSCGSIEWLELTHS